MTHHMQGVKSTSSGILGAGGEIARIGPDYEVRLARRIAECIELHRPRYWDLEAEVYWPEIREVLEELCREEIEKGVSR